MHKVNFSKLHFKVFKEAEFKEPKKFKKSKVQMQVIRYQKSQEPTVAPFKFDSIRN